MPDPCKLPPKTLLDLIKEDRNEIRTIKNRIYTYIQALIVAAFAVTAFYIRIITDPNTTNIPEHFNWIIIGTNVMFGVLSWCIFWVLNKDLHFVRKCLTWREAQLKKTVGDCFGDISDQFPRFWQWVLNKHWPTEFKNDGLLYIVMTILTAIYVVVIVALIFIL